MSTPLMRQYEEIKQRYPDSLILFQVGDFYELFYDDAKKAAAFLGIALTKRGYNNGEPIPLCGVPLHTKDHYITKLVKGGFKVALVDQLTPAVPGRMVERGVTCILTPGTLTDTKLLSEKSASYLASYAQHNGMSCLVFFELMTGEVWLTLISSDDVKMIAAEFMRFSPDEIVMHHSESSMQKSAKQQGYFVSLVTDQPDIMDINLAEHMSGEVLGLVSHSVAAHKALNLLYSYLQKNQQHALTVISSVFAYSAEDFLLMDAATQKNLELIKNLTDNGSINTLYHCIDGAQTSMGSRLIKKWITRPLLNKQKIEQRHQVVEYFVNSLSVRTQLVEQLKQVGDLERIVGRIMLQRAQIHDYQHLKRALCALKNIIPLISNTSVYLLEILQKKISSFDELYVLLEQALYDDTQLNWLIKAGYDAQLDRLRELEAHSSVQIQAFEEREIRATGISSLKVRSNNIQGYAIEITKANSALVPGHYQIIQNLVSRDRFITPELKQLEFEITHARQLIQTREQSLFESIAQRIYEQGVQLRMCAFAIAELDALLGFAIIAYQNGYVKPHMHEQGPLVVKSGKHPVVAQLLEHDYIPNDIHLNPQERVWLITGPNMGGKSTFLRQTALIAIMAQAGSFVPADSAQLPIFDRIFTRIGASDNVAQGKSTFYVEMEEAALICSHATKRSLVILDEVGRGTSTYDGLALAQAIVEYVYTQIGAYCLFATHYHELARLQEDYSGIKTYQAAVQETDRGIILLHKIIPGSASSSFGVQVARDAHIPEQIIARATHLLQTMPQDVCNTKTITEPIIQKKVITVEPQIHPVITKLQKLDAEHLTARQALELIFEFKQLI